MEKKHLLLKIITISCILFILSACTAGPENENGGVSQTTLGDLDCSSSPIGSLSIAISWQAPSYYNDESTPLNVSDIDQYKVYLGTQSNNYEYSVNINDPSSTSCNIPVDSTGSYFIAMTVVLKDGRESVFSNELLRTL